MTLAFAAPLGFNAGMNVLHDDADVLAVDKPAGVAAVPERAGDADCLVAQLQAERGIRLWVVHRLDKDTSGVILFAKTADAHRFLNRKFECHEVDKRYLAVVHGVVAGDRGTIDAPLRQFGSGRVAVDLERGRKSRTDYAVLERPGDTSLLELHPLTGRTHQIRAHLYHLGHPVCGDRRYGDITLAGAYPRLMLHAWRIRIPRPSGGEDLEVVAPPPPEFAAPA